MGGRSPTEEVGREGNVMSELESGAGMVEEASQIDRRDLLKKGVLGVGVAGVVWAAPHIDRLSLRPDYASAASVTKACSGDFTFDAPLPGTKNGPAAGSGNQLGKACTDLTLSIKQDYGHQVDPSRADRYWKTVKVDKASGGVNCTITKLTFNPVDVANGPCMSNAPTATGTPDQCSDNGANNGLYGSYQVFDSAGPGSHAGMYHTDTGYTITANGAYAHFASDPDQSSDLGPPSGGGNVKITVHCT
jgi:hypothetical protein